jgi:hypothetical protein
MIRCPVCHCERASLAAIERHWRLLHPALPLVPGGLQVWRAGSMPAIESIQPWRETGTNAPRRAPAQ